MALVRSHAVAKALNVTPRRVEQLVHEGMPRAGRGQYDLAACMVWYIRYLQKLVEARGPRSDTNGDGNSALESARIGVLEADKALKELALAKQRGEVVEVEVAARLWSKAIERMRARMIASVATAAVRWRAAASMEEAHGVVVEVVHDALREVVGVADEVADDTTA